MSSLGETTAGDPGERALLHGLRLIDGTGRAAVPDAALLIEGKLISWAGPAARLPADLGPVRRLDLGGRTLCPGFIATHVHLALPGPAGNPLQGLCELPSYRTPKVLDRLRATLENGVTTGVRIAMGTDSGLAVGHGRNLQELGLLVDLAGLSPMAAIVAATRDAARSCGVDDVTGTLEAGKAADLVVTDGDPLTDITAPGDPAHILAVVKEGRIAVDRAGVLGEGVLPALCP
ncbi:amidohydrolase family protein [Streptomyces sp. JH34]|uniref:amidohydrolase family protein n=1 Tax=Streptomyces sp. JH34 TaxID=2793633 RepID=UPI0023F7C60D|nr:amidohydrolase family protein [Streptomyces sp. JH34]MDF6018598.1 amidohydrolase family protein [Streptomyces sp. JH34]